MNFFDVGENLSSLPVILSSNLAPIFIITSQSCIAIFASYVPCIPNIPRKNLLDAGKAPNPIKVDVTGKLLKLEKFFNSFIALLPELIKPLLYRL